MPCTDRRDRRAELAIIHIARDQLGMDDDTYRALLQRVAGKSSATKLTDREREVVIAEFRRLGFKAASKSAAKHWPGRPRNTSDVPMLRKIEALLADAKRPWEYARVTAERMFNVERLEWLSSDQLHRLVAAMQADANRRRRRNAT